MKRAFYICEGVAGERDLAKSKSERYYTAPRDAEIAREHARARACCANRFITRRMNIFRRENPGACRHLGRASSISMLMPFKYLLSLQKGCEARANSSVKRHEECTRDIAIASCKYWLNASTRRMYLPSVNRFVQLPRKEGKRRFHCRAV